jgi:hypothetical protein
MKRTLPLVPVALAAACHAHHDDGFVTYPFTPVYGEVEPNDFAATAQYVQHLVSGSHLFIEGQICDPFCDPADGFAFTASGPLQVDFVLQHGPVVADLDVCVYDPALNGFLACFESPFEPETGSFLLVEPPYDFHLVVTSFFGASEYELEVTTSPIAGTYDSTATREPTLVEPRNPGAANYADAARDKANTPDEYPAAVQVGLLVIATPTADGFDFQTLAVTAELD